MIKSVFRPGEFTGTRGKTTRGKNNPGPFAQNGLLSLQWLVLVDGMDTASMKRKWK
jgi:hypothetical protein